MIWKLFARRAARSPELRADSVPNGKEHEVPVDRRHTLRLGGLAVAAAATGAATSVFGRPDRASADRGDVMVLGLENFGGDSGTFVYSTSSSEPSFYAYGVDGSGAIGGISSDTGSDSYGVRGHTTEGIGVWGTAYPPPEDGTASLHRLSDGQLAQALTDAGRIGVLGDSKYGVGVLGRSDGGSGPGIGLAGRATGGTGVEGSDAGAGTGVRGISENGTGAVGFSTQQRGVWGISGSLSFVDAGHGGAYGESRDNAGVVGVSINASGVRGVHGNTSGLNPLAGVAGESVSGTGVAAASSSGVGCDVQSKTGVALNAHVSNASSSADVARALHQGVGRGLLIWLTNSANGSDAATVIHSGRGRAIVATSTIGSALKATAASASNSAIDAVSHGTAAAMSATGNAVAASSGVGAGHAAALDVRGTLTCTRSGVVAIPVNATSALTPLVPGGLELTSRVLATIQTFYSANIAIKAAVPILSGTNKGKVQIHLTAPNTTGAGINVGWFVVG